MHKRRQVAEPSQAPTQSVHHVQPSELASGGRCSNWSALARRVCRGKKGVVSIDRGHSSLTCHAVVSDIYKAIVDKAGAFTSQDKFTPPIST